MDRRLASLILVIVLLVSFGYFGAIFALYVDSDLQTHALSIRDISDGKTLPPANFLFYLAVYITAFFHTGTAHLFLATSLVLAVAVTAKFLITRQLLDQHLQHFFPNSVFSSTIFLWLSLLMLVVFSLPTPSLLTGGKYYLGQIPPNVWHNSTTIFLMPFALQLFFKSYEQLEKPTTKGILILLVLCILNIVAKPSFFFVFCLVYPLMLLRAFGLKKNFWLNLIPVVVGVTLVGFQYYLIYKLSFGNLHGTTSGVTIDLLHVWSIYSTNITVSLLASLLFPLIYLGIYWRDLLENRLVQYSVLSYLAGLAMFCLLAETGTRLRDGNFFWQTVVCSYILFLVLLIQFMGKVKQLGLQYWKNRLILAIFSLHAISGIFYLVKLLVSRNFH